MKARTFIYNNLPRLNWIPIKMWKEDEFSHKVSRLIVVAYVDEDGINVTHGWSHPNSDYTAFSHCTAGTLDGGSYEVDDDCLIAVSFLCGFSYKNKF